MQLWYWSFSQSEFELPRPDLWRFYSQIIVRKYCSLIGSLATAREISTTCVSLFTLEISTVFEIPVLSLQSCILSTETVFLRLVKKKKSKEPTLQKTFTVYLFKERVEDNRRGGKQADSVGTHFALDSACWRPAGSLVKPIPCKRRLQLVSYKTTPNGFPSHRSSSISFR